jgi:hypothetical protein
MEEAPIVARLAGFHHVMQRLHRLLDRRAIVPAVDLVEIHIIGAQAAQAVVDLGHDRLARQAACRWVGSAHCRAGGNREEHLGGQHDLVALGIVTQGAADDLLAGTFGIDVRGVEGN